MANCINNQLSILTTYKTFITAKWLLLQLHVSLQQRQTVEITHESVFMSHNYAKLSSQVNIAYSDNTMAHCHVRSKTLSACYYELESSVFAYLNRFGWQ